MDGSIRPIKVLHNLQTNDRIKAGQSKFQGIVVATCNEELAVTMLPCDSHALLVRVHSSNREAFRLESRRKSTIPASKVENFLALIPPQKLGNKRAKIADMPMFTIITPPVVLTSLF
jgi:hypothetical protein